MKAGTAVECARVRLQIAAVIRDGRKASDSSASLDRMALLHHEALRFVIERDGDTSRPERLALGSDGIPDLVTFHVRFGGVRKGSRDGGSKLARRLFEQLKRVS